MLHRIASTALAMLAVAVAACGDARRATIGSSESAANGCTRCHGGVDNETGAPPHDVRGNVECSSPSVGAHTAHVQATTLAGGFGCAECHPDPRSGSTQHMNGTVDLAFGVLATVGGTLSPRFDPATSGCSAVYCHGAFKGGNASNVPVWTKVGQGQAACGTCHGVPPPTPHPAVSSDPRGCNICHAGTVDASGNVIAASAGGEHVDGYVEISPAHDPSWMDQASSGFHAYFANRGLAFCQECHGQNLDGGITGVACAQCHGGSWTTSCTMCHGGGDNQTGAPPRATWGNADDPVRVGAHSAHVNGSFTLPLDCDACHVKPSDALSPGHIDMTTATITWGALATTGGANPTWNRANATCSSTYCHGNYSGTFTYTTWDYTLDQPVTNSISYAGNNSTPNWTDGPMACDSCHGGPPQNGAWHEFHVTNWGCQLCHPDAAGGDSGAALSITNSALHVDGTVEVTPQWQTTCSNCH